MAVRFDYAML